MKYRQWLSFSILISGILWLSLLSTQPKAYGQAVSTSDPKFHVFLPAVANVPPSSLTPPLSSISYYLTSINPSDSYSIGCELGKRDLALPGKQDNLVVLDYGRPMKRGADFGTSGMWRNGFVTIEQIKQSAFNFGYGYWYCVGADFDSHVRIAIGTSNYADTDAAVTADHGKAWAGLVNQVNEMIQNCTRHCDGQLDAVGANDIELSWSGPTPTIDWVSGYDAANLYPLYNYGSLDGCPYFASPGARCANGWSKDQIWKVTSGGPVYSVPEVYSTNGVNAQQWYLMSLYFRQNKGLQMDFAGVMTQYGACQSAGGCYLLDNKPEVGWTQLNKLINGDWQTLDDLKYSTDIKWFN